MHHTMQNIMDASTDIGDGWRRTALRLAPGDTAPDATSTKWQFAGPGSVEYLIHPTGWIVRPGGSVTRQPQ